MLIMLLPLHAGLTQPHPNAACILVDPQGRSIGQAFQRAQGTTPAEVVAARQAGEAARGATAYLNLETGDCHGDDSAVAALIQSGVERVVVGLRHPLSHLRYVAAGACVRLNSSVSISIPMFFSVSIACLCGVVLFGILAVVLSAAQMHCRRCTSPWSSAVDGMCMLLYDVQLRP